MPTIEERVGRIFPNNYVYSKLLCETLLETWAVDSMEKRRPTVTIIRPAIVCAARHEPTPGFVASSNAFCAVLMAYGQGFLQRFPYSRDHCLDIVPVDVVANTILLGALASHSAERKFVVHVGSSASCSIPIYELFAGAHNTFRGAYPFPGSVLPCIAANRFLKEKDGSVEPRDEWPAEYRRKSIIAKRVEKQYCSMFSYFLTNSWLFEDTTLHLMQQASPQKVSQTLATSMSDFEETLPEYMENFANGLLSWKASE